MPELKVVGPGQAYLCLAALPAGTAASEEVSTEAPARLRPARVLTCRRPAALPLSSCAAARRHGPRRRAAQGHPHRQGKRAVGGPQAPAGGVAARWQRAGVLRCLLPAGASCCLLPV